MRQARIPYTAAVDLFSVGVVLYFMLYGRSPFWANTAEQIARKVAALNYEFPPNLPISDEAKDLIKKLLNRDPNQRPSATEALKHPWFFVKSYDTNPNADIVPDPCALESSTKEKERDSLNQVIDYQRQAEGSSARIELIPARESPLWKKRTQKTSTA